MDLIRKMIVLIHRKPQLPTLILNNFVPIVMHMDMMSITISHFTHNYGEVSHKTPMQIKVKVLGRAKRGKVQPTKG